MIYSRCKKTIWVITLVMLLLFTTADVTLAQNISNPQIIGPTSSNGSNGLTGSVTEITTKIYCPCGCNRVLANCDCETAISTKNSIKEKLNSGHNTSSILKDFEDFYGEQILVESQSGAARKASVGNGGGIDLSLIPFLLVGIGVAAFVAYKIGQRTSESKRPVKGNKKRRQ